MRPGSRSLTLRLALLAGALVVVLIVAELLLRLLGSGAQDADAWRIGGFHRPDSELIYSMKPNTSASWATGEFVEEVVTNSLGLRGDEIPAKPEGVRRILVLGDSMTFGHGVSADATYAKQLEGLYREQGKAIEVVNAGVKGYGNDQSVKFFETRLRGLDPDLVILAYYKNDLDDSLYRPLYALEDDQLAELDAARHPLYRYARIKQSLPAPLRELRLAQVATESLAQIGADEPEIPSDPEEQVKWASRKLELQLARLEALGAEDGFRVALLGLPYTGNSTDEYRWVRQTPRGGVALIDISRDPNWRAPRAGLFFESDPHLTPAGHLRVAKKLHRAIERRPERLLPDA